MLKKIYAVSMCAVLAVVAGALDASAAVAKKTSKQSAIQKTTTVRTRVAPTGLYDQECYDAYYGCMDQFCITDNSNGGSCACSDANAAYEEKLAKVKEILAEAERVSTEEVERVQAGANADIIFAGERKYDEDGNVISVDDLTEEDSKEKERQDLMALFEDNLWEEDEEVFEDAEIDIFSLTGAELHAAANDMCMQQIPEKCAKDAEFLSQVYARQIVSDCKGFENSLSKQMEEANNALAAANSAVRGALRDSFNAANKFDRGQCMVEFKKCMLTDDACGKDWINCVSVIASENMQNQEAKSTAGTTVATVDKYDITASTMEILESKRNICENVLDQCMAVRDMVWPDFLREAAPTIKVAELSAESKFRQSCLTDISDCIHKACMDDIAGKGVATMDACLSRPDMARSFCKVEIDPCERMEPLIWGYVVDKLAAMRVDACTDEVKACFTADTRCGENFQNCIGMDYDYIHDICPVDSLVVCKANNPGFAMDDLDSMLMGLYLNIDNAFIDQCQTLVDTKMAEICGSTTDCNKFAADDLIGTGSLRSQKDGNVYRVTGMISFGSIKMGSASGRTTDGNDVLKPGQIGIEDYLAKVREQNANVENAEAIIPLIEEELNNIAGTINRTIEMIEQDPEIQFCVNGRDLSQITGKAGQKTQGRFPNLLNQVKMQIAVSALRKAQDNYNTKLNTAITEATKDASADLAQYMCQMLPYSNGATLGTAPAVDTPLTVPYAISYEVGSGLDNSALLAGAGKTSGATSGAAVTDGTAGASKFGEVVSAFTGLGGDKVKVELPGGTREMWALFNRDTRTCHYCTSTVTKNCKSNRTKGFLGIGAKNTMECEESAPVEKCQDIPM